MKKFTVMLEDGIHLKAKLKAVEMKISMCDYIVRAILEKLLHDEQKDKE